MTDTELLKYFDDHKLAYTLYKHAAVFSAKDDCEEMKSIPGAHSKNLFLKDKKGNYILVSVLEHKRVDLKVLSATLGFGRFSFGNAEELLRFVGVTPGSVTPFGLIHDDGQRVAYFLDEDFLRHEQVNFHPLTNTQTVSMQRESFLKFFELIKHSPKVIAIPCLE